MARVAKNPFGHTAGGKYTPNVGMAQRTSDRKPTKISKPPVSISLNTKKYGRGKKK